VGTSVLLSELASDSDLDADDEKIGGYFENLSELNVSEAQRYWKDLLDGVNGYTLLPVYGKISDSSSLFARNRWLGDKLGARILDFCTERKVTFAAFMHTALGMALAGLTGLDTVCFKTTGSGRGSCLTDDPDLIGMFATQFPFVYRRGDTVFDSQKQILESLGFEWIDHDLLGQSFAASKYKETGITLDMLGFVKETETMDHMLKSIGAKYYDHESISSIIYAGTGDHFNITYCCNPKETDPDALLKLADLIGEKIDMILEDKYE
jgi:hypothetical protein